MGKYLTKKKKDLVEYSKVLETLITLENNTLWKNKQEFSAYAKDVINYYVDHYYFDNNTHRDNPIEYSNDNINSVLKSLIEYCKEVGKTSLLIEKKNETFLLSVIITTACYVDISTNVVDGNYSDTKNKFKYLLQYLQKTNILKVYINNQTAINNLFKKLKATTTNEDKFFKAFVQDNSYNKYQLYTKEPDYNLVSYMYKIDGLDEFDQEMVKKINKEYEDKYLNISYELLSVELLKEYISNSEVKTYLIPVTESSIKKESNFSVLSEDILKKQVKILLNYEDAKKYKDYISKLENIGFSFIYKYDGNSEVSQNTFIRNMDVIVSESFLKVNEDKVYSWKNQGINFIIKNEEDVQ